MKPNQPTRQTHQVGGIYACTSREQLVVFLEVQAKGRRPLAAATIVNGVGMADAMGSHPGGRPTRLARRDAAVRNPFNDCTSREQMISYIARQAGIA